MQPSPCDDVCCACHEATHILSRTLLQGAVTGAVFLGSIVHGTAPADVGSATAAADITLPEYAGAVVVITRCIDMAAGHAML